MSLEKLTATVQEVEAVLIKVGLSPAEINTILDHQVDHARAEASLRQVISAEVAAWLVVRAKVTEGMWDYYEATGESGLIECKQLKKASHAVRVAWRTRVVPFYKEAKRLAIDLKMQKRLEAKVEGTGAQ